MTSKEQQIRDKFAAIVAEFNKPMRNNLAEREANMKAVFATAMLIVMDVVLDINRIADAAENNVK